MKTPINDFIHELTWDDLPQEVQGQSRRCLLDTLGAAIAGRSTECSRIIHDYAAAVFGGQGASLWQDGRTVSPPGAALANAMTIDSLDIHDGLKMVKGHAGTAVVPAVFATLELPGNKTVNGKELLTTVIVGYEIALRAGLALHNSSCDYHSSGAWNTLGCAAVTARRLRLTPDQTRQALGIAEYYGPRSQIMRVVDFPTMVKDGSGWGAMAGVSAGLLAASGFTGAPAVTVEDESVRVIWDDLGKTWHVSNLYFKPYAVCYWAQPAIAGALSLQTKYQINPGSIKKIKVYTFLQATHLRGAHPNSTDEAQYSLPFPVAAALIYHQLGPKELDGGRLREQGILALAEKVELIEFREFSEQFPAKRFARVVVEKDSGEQFDSGVMPSPWEPGQSPSDAELINKFRWLSGTQLTSAKCMELESFVWNISESGDVKILSELLR